MAVCSAPSFSLPVEQYIVQRQYNLEMDSQLEEEFEEQILAAAATPLSYHEQIRHAQIYGTDLGQYLLEEEHDPITLTRLIRESSIILDEVFYTPDGVTLPESCMTFGWPEPFEAFKDHDLLDSIGSRSRHLLQIACEKQFTPTDLREIQRGMNRMPNSHPAKHIAPQDIFIAIILLSMFETDRNWRDVNLTPEAIARIATVEAQLFAAPQSKL